MDKYAAPYVLSLGVVWGLNLVVSRFGISQFDVLAFTGLRLLIAVIVFAGVIAVLPGRSWSRDPVVWRDAAIVGVFGTAFPLLGFVASLRFQSAGVTSLLATTGPAFIVTVAHFMLPDAKLTRTAVLGVLTALTGGVLIIARGETGLPDITEANPLGYAIVIGVLLIDSFMAVYIRRRMQTYDTFQVTGIRLLAAMLFVAPFALLVPPMDYRQVTTDGWVALVYTGIVSTVIAQFLFFYITRAFGTTSLAITIYIVPLAALVAGVVFLGETITPGMVAGMALIVTGIYLINRARFAAPKPALQSVPRR